MAKGESGIVFAVCVVVCIAIVHLSFLLFKNIKDCESKLKEACPIVKQPTCVAAAKPQPAIVQAPQSPHTPSTHRDVDIIYERDTRVLRDELYPPYNRSATETTRDYATNPAIRSRPTRDSSDTYRLVGYLVDQEDKNDVWKLYAREKYRGSRSEFYAAPANNNYDMKVFIEHDMVEGPNKLNDVLNLPSDVRIKHPMFTNSSYNIVELPKSDFSSGYY